jgi:hypothetical protein
MNDKSERDRYENFIRRNILAAKNINERKYSVRIEYLEAHFFKRLSKSLIRNSLIAD